MRSGPLFAPFVLAGGLLFAAVPADALCVNNGTGIPVRIDVLVGGEFKARVDPGEMRCCSWEDATCNSGLRRFASLQFVVTALTGPQVRTGVCRGSIPASYEIQIRQTEAQRIRCVGVR